MRRFPPERIVCLTEETVETLYLLGEEDRIVGVSGYAVRLMPFAGDATVDGIDQQHGAEVGNAASPAQHRGSGCAGLRNPREQRRGRLRPGLLLRSSNPAVK